MDAARSLADALGELRSALASTRFAVEVDDAPDHRAERDALVRQLDDHLLPRLRQLDAPLLAVVGGSTGAGKSTLVNSLVGQAISPSGVLRPTTRAPVLVCHPADRSWFADARVLPGLPRVTGGPGGPGTLQLVTAERLGPGVALLDAPDIDSVVVANRELGAQLLAAADLWVFVTTAARYADAVPWTLLVQARARRAAVAVVLDRVPPEALDEVTRDLRRMLDEQGLDAALLHTVREVALIDGLLPDVEVAPLRQWLASLAQDADARRAVVRRTVDGALQDVERRVGDLVAAAARQGEVAAQLRTAVVAPYDEARQQLDVAVRDGTLLRGEVLERWQEFVGTGELMRSMQARIGALRDRVRGALAGRPAAASGVQVAVEGEVEALVHAAADAAAEAAVGHWQQSAPGRALLGDDRRALARASSALLDRLPEEVRAWQGAVLELVRAEGAGKRTGARVASYTVNGAGLAVMLAVFAETGGLTGAEVAVAGGTTAASQKVLEAVFGDQAVRTLARAARSDLLARMGALLETDAQRFHARLDAAVDAEPALGAALERWRRAARQQGPLP